MNIGALRRRVLINTDVEDAIKVEKPDYFRIDFATQSADEKLHIGYYALDSRTLADVILDGEHVTTDRTVVFNGDDAYLNIKNPGQHTVYIKITMPFQGAYAVSYPTVDSHSTVAYFRIPYTYNTDISVQNQTKIETVDNLRPSPQWHNGAYGWKFPYLGVYRIPKGSMDTYQNSTYFGNAASVLKPKLVEVKFKY